MYLSVLIQFFLLGCISQFLDAAPSNNGNLPFEVDMNDGNTGIDQGHSTQPNKQAENASKKDEKENFVASPKPANSQGFSFDSEPESIAHQPTKTTAPMSAATTGNGKQKPVPITDTAPVTSPTIGPKRKRKPTGDVTFSPALPVQMSNMNTAASMFNDPFFQYALQEFLRQQELLMNWLSSDLTGMPNNQFDMMNPMLPMFGNSGFQMPSMNDLQNTMNVDNMELVEDRVFEDGKGHLQTFKSKDGNAVIQTMTYNLGDDSVNDDKTFAGASASAVSQTAEQTKPVTTEKSSLPSSRRSSFPKMRSPMNMISPLRARVH